VAAPASAPRAATDEKTVSAPAQRVPQKHPPPANGTVGRLRKYLRWVIIPYLLVLALGALITIVGASYGLAHASGKDASIFLLKVLGVVAVLALPALTLLLKKTSPAIVALQAISLGLVIVPVVGFVLVQAFESSVRPRSNEAALRTASIGITARVAQEKPLMLGETQIGAEIDLAVTLPHDVPLPYPTSPIAAALENSTIWFYAVAPDGNSHLPLFFGRQSSQIKPTRMDDGRPLKELPAIRDALDTLGKLKHSPRSIGVLPKGTYTMHGQAWFPGLRESRYLGIENPGSLCRMADKDWLFSKAAKVVPETAVPLKAAVHESISARGPSQRGPYMGTGFSALLETKFDITAWKETLGKLPIPSCEEADAAFKASKERAEAERK
jgi:hypothetical protein